MILGDRHQGDSIDFTGLAMLTGIAVLIFLGYELYKHASLFNPLSQKNAANQGFNALYQNLTGSTGTLGSDLSGLLNPPTVPVNQTPSTALCYARDASGALLYDSNGNIEQVPCSQNPPGYQTP